MWNHLNLRLFDEKRRIISHQRSGFFVPVWRAYIERTRVCVARACTRVFAQDMTRVHVKMKSQEKIGALNVYYPPAIVCCVCMYSYVLVCYSYVLVRYPRVTLKYSYVLA